MAISYRRARADELERAEELVANSINDLCVRHGFGRIASARPPHFQLFSLNDDPDGLWIAEERDEIRGFLFSWVCEDLWFLAELFVAPGHQGGGIGKELLARGFAHAARAGATTRALVTFAFNTVSQGLYIRNGLFPSASLSFVKAERAALAAFSGGSKYETTPIGAGDIPELVAIDRHTLGVSREKHHRYLATDSTIGGVLLRDGRAIVGYAYINRDGHVGPLAVTRAEAMDTAFRSAVGIAMDRGAAQVTALIPGGNDAAFRVAAACGMRVAFPFVLMSSRAFGDWTRYLPRNPGFM